MFKKESAKLEEIDKLLTKGNYREGLEIIDEYLSESDMGTPFQIELLLRKSKIHFYIADYTTCLTLANKSLILSEVLDDSLLIIDSLQIEGEVKNELGQTGEFASILKQIEEQLETIHEKTGIASQKRRAEYNKLVGLFQMRRNEMDKAIENFQKSLTFFQQQGNEEKIAEVLFRLGYASFVKGDKDGRSIILDAIKIQEKIGNREVLSGTLLGFSNTFLRNSELKEASLYIDKVFKILKNTENKNLLGQVNLLQGLIYYLSGEFSSALKFLNKSLDFFKEIDNKGLIGSLVSNIALIHRLRGNLDLSLASFDYSLRIFEELDIKRNVAYHLDRLGSVYSQKGDYDLAFVYFYKALEITKKLNVENSIGMILYNIISVSIFDNDLENAQQYLKQLQKLNKKKTNDNINLWSRVAEALVLKFKRNEQDLERALNILKQIAEEKIINIEIYGDVLLNLCDILLNQIRKNSNEESFTEMKKYLYLLYEMASKQESLWLIAQANWLLAYLALIELDIVKAHHMFTQAQQIAEEKGFKRLAMTISNEFDIMLRDSQAIELTTKKDLSLANRVERSGFENIIKKIKQNYIDAEDLPVEKPVMLIIFNPTGIPIYHQTFLQEKIKHNDMIIEEFTLSISNILKDTPKGKKPLQRILYRDLLVILKSFNDLSFCYVFDGQSYTALEKLETIITSLQNQLPELWNTILEQSQKGESVDPLTEQNLVFFVKNLFTSSVSANN